MGNSIQLSRAQWGVVGAFVGLAFSTDYVITSRPSVADWCAVTRLAPAIERDLEQPLETTGVAGVARGHLRYSEVRPGGALDRAGGNQGTFRWTFIMDMATFTTYFTRTVDAPWNSGF